MKDAARESVTPHAAVETKRVIPDVIATAEQGPQSIAGLSPAGATSYSEARKDPVTGLTFRMWFDKEGKLLACDCLDAYVTANKPPPFK